MILLFSAEIFLFSGKMFISSKSSLFKEFNDFNGKEFGLL